MSEATDLLAGELAATDARLDALEGGVDPGHGTEPQPEPPHGSDPDPQPPHGSDPVPSPEPPHGSEPAPEPDPLPPGPAPDPGEWPDNEPVGLVPVFPGHPTIPGVLVDGSDLRFDYRSQGGEDLGIGWRFGRKWDGVRILKTVSPGSKYPGVIRKNMLRGDVSGWNGKTCITNFASNYEALYFRLVSRFSDNWQFHGSTDKLFYWGKANGSGSAFYINIQNGSVLQVVNQAKQGGDTGVWRSGTVVTRGEWHTLELIVTAQSAVGTADGSFRVILDGVEVGFGRPSSAIEWYGSGSSTRLFSGLQFPLYWGGGGSTKTVNDYLDISELYITGKEAIS